MQIVKENKHVYKFVKVYNLQTEQVKHDSGAVGSQRFIFYWYREKETFNDSAPWTFVGEEARAKDDKINIENGNKDEDKACDVKNPDYLNLCFILIHII